MNKNYIPRDIVTFGRDYIKKELPKYNKGHEIDIDRLRYWEARRLFEAIFMQDQQVNPGQYALKDYFNFDSKEGLEDVISKIRLEKGISALIPLNLWVAFAEGSVVNNDEESRLRYERIFKTGLMQSDLRRVTKFKNQIEPKDLYFLIRSQSPSVNRSIIEITSNAIDFSPKDSKVEVMTSQNGYSVRDYGKGMTPKELLEELSIPFVSGARDASKASIGKFGMGFMTILNHLNKDGDKVVVDTGRNGKGYRIEFTILNDNIYVTPSLQNEILQGTRISLTCDSFDEANNISELYRHLEFKRGAKIIINSKRVEKPVGVVTIETKDKSIAVSFRPKGKDEATKGSCEVVITVNGVKISGVKVDGINLPELVAIDLPYSTRITESRDVVVYDKLTQLNFLEALEAIEGARSINSRLKVQLLNAFIEVVYKLEQTSNIVSYTIIPTINESMANICEKGNLTYVPAIESCDLLDVPKAVYINPKFAELVDKYISGCYRLLSAVSKQVTVHLTDFKSIGGTPVIRFGNRLLVDTYLYEQISGSPAWLQGFINEEGMFNPKGAEDKIYVEFMTPEGMSLKQQSIKEKPRYPDLPQRFDRRCWELIMGLSSADKVTGISKIFLDPKKTLQNVEGYYKAFFQRYYGELPYNLKEKISEYISGNSNSLDLDFTELKELIENLRSGLLFNEQINEFTKYYDIDPNKIRELAKAYIADIQSVIDNPDIQSIEIYRLLRTFMRKETLKFLQSMEKEPSEVESIFCEAFLNFYQDFFGQDLIDEVKESFLSHLKFKENSRDFSDYAEGSPSQYMKYEYLSRLILTKENRSGEQDDKVAFSICRSLKSLVDLMLANRNYLVSRSRLNPSQKIAYDRLFQLDLGRDSGSYLDLLNYDYSGNLRFHSDVCNGIAEFFLRNPDSEEWVYETILPLCEDTEFNRAGIVVVMSFLTDPYAAFRYYKNGLLSSSVESDGGVFSQISSLANSKKKLTFDLKRGNINGIYQVSNPDEILIKLENSRNKAKISFSNLGSKYFYLNEMPIVTSVKKKMNPLLMDLFSGLFKPHYELSEFDLLGHIDELSEKSAGVFAPFSDRKKALIENYLQKNFSPELMTRDGYISFLCFLKRIFYHADLDDELFGYLMPMFAYIPPEDRRTTGFSLSNNLFSNEMLEVLSSKKEAVGRINIVELLRMWYEIVKNRVSGVDKFGRLVDIFEDIAKKPKVLQNHLFEILRSDKGSDTVNGYGWLTEYLEYYHFCVPNSPIENIDTFLVPYLIYFRDGDLSKLRSGLDIEITPNGDKVLLSELILFRRMRSGDFEKVLSTPDSLKTAVREYADGKNKFIAQRELLHAVNHLPANDSYLFLRELIQNAYDGYYERVHDGERFASKIEIKDYRKGDYYVLECRDSIGMSFETLIGTLLIPNTSSKKKVGQLGRFGIGFMSVLQGCDKVEILSGTDSGHTAIVITPVVDDYQQVADYEVEFRYRKEPLRGTTVRKYTSGQGSSIQSAQVQGAVIKYGSYLDSQRVKVMFGSEIVNKGRLVLSERKINGIGKLQIVEGTEKSLLQGRLFVVDLPQYIIEMIPIDIRELVLKSGLTLNLDSSVELIRSRSDIANKDYYLPLLRSVIPEMVIECLLNRFSSGKLDLAMIPYDYFWDNGFASSVGRTVLKEIIEDAESLNRGKGITDFSLYFNKDNLLQLLTVIKFYEFRGKKLSLSDFASLAQRNEIDETQDLPDRIKQLLLESKKLRMLRESNRKDFKEKKENEVHPFVPSNREIKILSEHSDTHYALMMVLSEINTYNDKSLGFYNKPNLSIATAYLRQKVVCWNLCEIQHYLDRLQEAIQRVSTISDKELAEIIFPFVTTGTHEDAHLSIGSPSWTMHHNDFFYAEQKRLFGQLLYRQTEILNSIRQLFLTLEGTMLKRNELLKMMGF